MPTTPPSPNGNRDAKGPRIIGAWEHLAEDEITMIDDLIRKLSSYEGLDLRVDNDARYHFWMRVFHSGWDTSDTVPRIPDKQPTRTFSKSALAIGSLLEDAVSGSAPKRNRDGTQHVSAKRKAGQPVFVRPQLRRGPFEIGVDFQYVDGDGRTVSTDTIRLDPAFTIFRAWSQAIKHYEGNESDRVNEWNCDVLVMWARNRLREYLGLVDHMSVAAARDRASANGPQLEDEGRLVQLVSAGAKLADMKNMVAQLEIPGAVPGWKGVSNGE